MLEWFTSFSLKERSSLYLCTDLLLCNFALFSFQFCMFLFSISFF
uniref:Transmembrane protein n=1 Tax=Medicago truncatula TaxID=3880 RepID=I3SKM0_MEDTR|nr:unknown [Medicago truncatula]